MSPLLGRGPRHATGQHRLRAVEQFPGDQRLEVASPWKIVHNWQVVVGVTYTAR